MEDTRLLLIEEKKREKTTVVLYDFVCTVRVGFSIVRVYGKIMQKIRKQSNCIDCLLSDLLTVESCINMNLFQFIL